MQTPFRLSSADAPGVGRPLPDGVIVCGLAEALQKHPQLVEPHLARHADFKRNAFTALNTAFLRDGAFVYVPADVAVEAADRSVVRGRRARRRVARTSGTAAT